MRSRIKRIRLLFQLRLRAYIIVLMNYVKRKLKNTYLEWDWKSNGYKDEEKNKKT